MLPCPPRTSLKWRPIVYVLLACLFLPTLVVADVGPPPAREFGDAEQAARDSNTLTIAIYLAILLTVAVVSGFILMLLWGARVRRQARKPLPATSPVDRLWYLKSQKSPHREPNGPTSVSDGETETEPPEDDSSSA